MASTPAAITADSRLSTDYLLATNLLVDTTVSQPLTMLVLPDGTPSALVFLVGSGLTHITPDSSSASGWKLTAMPQNSNAVEVAAGVASDGQAHAYYQNGANTLHSVLGDTGWSDPEQLDLATSLTAAFTADSSELNSVVGISATGGVTIFVPGKAPATQAVTPSLFGAQIVVNLSSSEILTIAAVAGSAVTLYYLPLLTQDIEVRSIPTADLKASRVHFVYLNDADATTLVYSDSDNALWFFSAPLPNQSLPPRVGPQALGATVQQGAGVLDADELIHFFGVSPDGSMWVLNQLDWNSSSAPDWAQIFPLDVNVQLLAGPPDIEDASTLFAVGVDQTLHILTQDPTTQQWTRNVLLSPTPDVPLELPRYRTELSVTDTNGTPFPGAQVTLSSAVEVAILNAGTTFFVGPDASQAVTLTTDALGKVTFSYPAGGLSAPVFTAAVSGTQLSLTVTPHQYLHDFLGGQASLNTGSVAMSTFSSDVVQSATVNGQPLVASGTDPAVVDCVVESIQSVIGIPSGTTVASAPAGLAVDLRDPKRPQMIRFSTAAELEAHRARLRQDTTLGSVWSDIAGFFEDIWYALKTGALAFTSWVIDAANKVVSFVVQIGDDVQRLVDMAVQGVEDAISAVHAFFNVIGADIKKVLDWLKDLFAWTDIWNTKLVLEHLVQQLAPALEWMIAQKALPAVQSFFTGLQDKVDGAFSSAISRFSDKSIAASVNPDDPSQASTQGGLTASLTPSGASSAQHSWLTSKLQDNVPSGLVGQLTGGSSLGALDTFWSLIPDPSVSGSFQTAFSSLEDFFSKSVTDPSSLPTTGVADLLTAMQALLDAGLEILKDLLEALLEALEGGIGDLWTALTQALPDIPVISWLWSNVLPTNGATMSVLGLGTLALAFPVTILFKLANGEAPPFDATTTQQILSMTFQPPQMGSTNAAVLAAASPPFQVSGVIELISLFQGVVDALVDVASSAGNNALANVFGWADALVNLPLLVLSFPEFLQLDVADFTPAQQFALATWAMGLVPFVLNLWLLVAPEDADQPRQILESVDTDGKVFLSIWGVVTLGLGVAAAVLGIEEEPPTANDANLITAILAPGVNALQFLRINSVAEDSEGVSVAVKVVADFVLDLSAGFLQKQSL